MNYVETPYRYTLTMNDTQVIGKRRAAQRIGAAALRKLEEARSPQGEQEAGGAVAAPSTEETEGKVQEALGELIEEMKGDETAAKYLADLDKPTAAADEGDDEDEDL